MKRFLRRIRGILGTALTWAIGWGAAGAGLHLFGIGLSRHLGETAFFGAFLGFLAGGSFAVTLAAIEGRRRLDQLSLGRVGLWGALGGVAVAYWFVGPISWSAFSVYPVLFIKGMAYTFVPPILLGAGFAAGSVALARRGDNKMIEDQRESLLGLEEDPEPERIG